MKSKVSAFELHRHADGLVYCFQRQKDQSGVVGFKRTDGDYWITRHPQLGWIATTPGHDEVFGRPWDVAPTDQGEAPPTGIWVSRKGSKSYVYDLVHVEFD